MPKPVCKKNFNLDSKINSLEFKKIIILKVLSNENRERAGVEIIDWDKIVISLFVSVISYSILSLVND